MDAGLSCTAVLLNACKLALRGNMQQEVPQPVSTLVSGEDITCWLVRMWHTRKPGCGINEDTILW